MKVLLSDVDGTLYFSNRENDKISISDIEAIERFQEKGHLFGVCTGRSYAGVMSALANYPIILDFMILSSGSIIIVDKNVKIKETLLSLDIVKSVYRLLNLKKCGISITSDKGFYFSDYLDYTFSGAQMFENINELKEPYYTNISIESSDIEELERVKKILTDELNYDIEVNRNNQSLDISPKNCNKEIATLELKEYYKITNENIFVIGDSFNDIPMFRATKNSYTFNCSAELVKNSATHLVDSLAECINQILE